MGQERKKLITRSSITYAKAFFMQYEAQIIALAETPLGKGAVFSGSYLADMDLRHGVEFSPPKVGLELPIDDQMVNTLIALSYEKVFYGLGDE